MSSLLYFSSSAAHILLPPNFPPAQLPSRVAATLELAALLTPASATSTTSPAGALTSSALVSTSSASAGASCASACAATTSATTIASSAYSAAASAAYSVAASVASSSSAGAAADALTANLPGIRTNLLASHAPLTAATVAVLEAAASHLPAHLAGPPLHSLLPLLVDLVSFSGASAVGTLAHHAVCHMLPLVPALEPLPSLLDALDNPRQRSPAPTARARQLLCHELLLALLVGASGGDSAAAAAALAVPSAIAAPAPTAPTPSSSSSSAAAAAAAAASAAVAPSFATSAAPESKGESRAIARTLRVLVHDPRAGTRSLARHALLVLMERHPRAASDAFGRLPLRTQRQITATAKRRASALGPPLLPTVPPTPPTPQATLLQAVARGHLERRRRAHHASWVATLPYGARLGVVAVARADALHAGTLRYRGLCAFAPGEWLGVELDAPCGKHDGAIKGVRTPRRQPTPSSLSCLAPRTRAFLSPSCPCVGFETRAPPRGSLVAGAPLSLPGASWRLCACWLRRAAADAASHGASTAAATTGSGR